MTEQEIPAADPADLAELQYPELERRRDALAGAIEAITIEGGIFDERLPSRIADLSAIRDALRRKRETSAGKGTRRDPVAPAGVAPRDD
jgi:hypothetical protein